MPFYASDQMKLNQYFELLGAIRYDQFHDVWTTPATRRRPTAISSAPTGC